MTLGGPRWQSEVSQRSLREAVRGSQRLSAALGGTRWLSVAVRGHSAYHQEDCHRSPQTLHSSVSSASSHARPTPLHLHVGFTHEGLALPSAGLRTLDACNSLRSSASSPKSSTSVAAAFASRLVCRRGAVTPGHVRSRQVTSGHVRSRQVTSGHVRSRQVTSGHARSRQVTSSHARSATRRGTQEHYVSLRSTTWHSAALSRQWYSHLEQLGEVLGCESAQLQRRGRRG